MARNCVNNQYTFQEFLLECPYDGIMIENCMITYLEELQDHHVGYNLLDYMDGIVRRTIELSELDQLIDTEDDFDTFINNHRWIDELIIVNNRPHFDNPILSRYSFNTLKSYLYRINNAGIMCFVSQYRKLRSNE